MDPPFTFTEKHFLSLSKWLEIDEIKELLSTVDIVYYITKHTYFTFYSLRVTNVFLCFPFWMCQIFYRRANNITISEALYFWYPRDSAPLLFSDWLMFWILASHWSILTIGCVGTRDLRGGKTFETDLLLLFPELHKALNNRQVSEVNKEENKNINQEKFFLLLLFLWEWMYTAFFKVF